MKNSFGHTLASKGVNRVYGLLGWIIQIEIAIESDIDNDFDSDE